MADSNLWFLIHQQAQVDPDALAEAIEQELGPGRSPDHRTRVLIRDGTAALRQYWGAKRHESWLGQTRAKSRIEAIEREDLGKEGFPSLRRRLVAATSKTTVIQYLMELGNQVATPVRIVVGGSIALILSDLLSKHTEDLDLVDEVPTELRAMREVLARLEERFGLQLAFFQSHYLPGGWEQRTRFFDTYGHLQVSLVDALDIFVGKLFSAREKDREDLRVLSVHVDRDVVGAHLRDWAKGMAAVTELRRQAEYNWKFLYQEGLPLP